MSELTPEQYRRAEMLITLREAIESGEPLKITLSDDHDGDDVRDFLRDLCEEEYEIEIARESDGGRTLLFHFIGNLLSAEEVCDKIFEGTESLELDEI